MTIASGKKHAHPNREVANELRHISQVHKILKSLEKRDIIVSFKKIPSGLNNSLNYRIFYYLARHLDIVLCPERKIKLANGAEIAEQHGWKLVIFLNKDCKPKRIQSIIMEEIRERKMGLLIEKMFHENVLALIASDKEISQVLKSVRKAEYHDDDIRKIDFFLILRDKTEVPIQIKSSLCGQRKHKKLFPDVPSLVYNPNAPGLKEKILQICRYPKIIEHL